LQTHNTKFFEDPIGGRLNPLTPALGMPVDESQRRQHGVTTAIVVDVVGALRPCVSLSVRPSLRWSFDTPNIGLYTLVRVQLKQPGVMIKHLFINSSIKQ